MLKYHVITNENYEIALEIQNKIFPKYSAKTNYLEAIENITSNVYYLLFNGIEYVGVSGVYSYNIDPKSAWLGWFGIIEKYRKQGYGSEALLQFEKTARENGYKFTRLYTDKYNNDMALNFYKKRGYSFEDYVNIDDEASLDFPIMIGSKALEDDKIEPWNDRNIEFTEQLTKQNRT